ncbi:hypothetical protein CcI156_21045 [Frankia sp. CcI156]|uniref:Uncharacterized protein n=1 Tax=Frankia casuarinae (strain DSM 45818 / CECT 9043 / HFP020203 / CcI3) TaxID=106370 RepID=Q2JAT1_FRACC|nr:MULTISPECIES: hypothetical protein [Frankia]ABD11611.1 hypothetical protein Francci3_2243 [Frankia casuarinae]ETA00114.1 hypothetical protein CcI6DRAFT_04490 [Frankia sp. CcI6]EYT90293.1 hypothetical protein ThrDRAFT_04060 [Frankia casuarinae]KDA41119.1 hypothetical protein BMG523Draft_04042 [Frankia sp. BMG5.23]ONH22492.1 hypothetical protein CcI156_21045 [Frankia sp. CcI156]
MNAVDDWIHARRDTLTWLDCDRYVWRVFAGAPERWYDDPATLVAASAQAHRLLRSDVYGVNVSGPFSRHLVGDSEAAAVCAALELPAPRRVLADTLDALLHQFGDRVDLVLDCPSPRRLLASGAGIDFDALDDVATGLLEVIRSVADRPVRGLQITCDTAGGPDEDETDAWSSLLAAAGHYGWITAVRLNGVTDPDQLDPKLPGDLLLLPHLPAGVLPDDRRYGGGLPAEVWSDTSEAARLLDAAAKRGFRFGEIPTEASPEIVLTRLTALAAGTH